MNRKARIALVVALAVVVLLAFRVSWNALRDVGTAIGLDTTAANIYPIVVDGLMALALVATLVLVGRGKRLALGVLGGYTVASLVLNYVHGLMPALHRPAGSVPLEWPLVLLATSLPVGAIFFGSDLVARVLRAGDAQPVTAPVIEERPEAPEVTTERADIDTPPERPEPVMPPVAALEFRPLAWPPETTADVPAQMTAAVPAETGREVVTEVVTLTPAELRKRARALNREVVRSTGRPVTIDRLREEYGLSRREATELRRDIVKESRS
jgi:hypothetical protein